MITLAVLLIDDLLPERLPVVITGDRILGRFVSVSAQGGLTWLWKELIVSVLGVCSPRPLLLCHEFAVGYYETTMAPVIVEETDNKTT